MAWQRRNSKIVPVKKKKDGGVPYGCFSAILKANSPQFK